jgi:hypothetical protein
LPWQCVLATPNDNEKHKNRKIVLRTAWAKIARRYFKKINREKRARGMAQVTEQSAKN